MRANIHPTWNSEAKVVCACGASFTTGSTQDSIRVDICSVCHPFFTGQQKLVDTLGQVDKFRKMTEKAAVQSEAKKKILEARAEKKASEKTDKLSLKDLLMQARKSLKS